MHRIPLRLRWQLVLEIRMMARVRLPLDLSQGVSPIFHSLKLSGMFVWWALRVATCIKVWPAGIFRRQFANESLVHWSNNGQATAYCAEERLEQTPEGDHAEGVAGVG